MKGYAAAGMWLAVTAGLAGCASPGPPRPPSLQLPAVVRDLSAERRGDAVLLHFAVPTRSTDNFALSGPVTASLCRAPGDAPCLETGRRTVSGDVEWVDKLPASLTVGPAVKLSYRVELFNSRGRSAGRSEPAITAAGRSPAPVEGFRAQGSRGGARLLWAERSPSEGQVIVQRAELSAAPKLEKAGGPITLPTKSFPGKGGRKPAPRSSSKPQEPGVVWLQAETTPAAADSGGMVDDTAASGVRYRYTAERVREVIVDGRKVQMHSAVSAPVEFTLQDIYPPAAPLRLAAAVFPVEGSDKMAVDLIWQPVTESDVAGYFVYRAESDRAAAPLRLNAEPVALPSFHDETVLAERKYRYTVRAVDNRKNESPDSEAVEIETKR